jgi:hypothetical protein
MVRALNLTHFGNETKSAFNRIDYTNIPTRRGQT